MATDIRARASALAAVDDTVAADITRIREFTVPRVGDIRFAVVREGTRKR
jgi:hypothetical protein